MKSIFRILLVLLSFQWCFSQDNTTKEVDSLYKEDQFYIGITYDLLGNKTNGFSQNGFSTGFHFGFINDIPLNEKRNVAIGVGLGVSINSFNQNLLIDKNSAGSFKYSLLDGSSTYSKNRFYRNLIELPIEFRWRTSTPSEYKFWRIYTGFKLGYIITSGTKFKGEPESIKHNNISDFNKFQYGVTLSAGYNTWNLYLYYGLNPIFTKDAVLNGNSIDLNAIKVGLMFYVL
jgi:hypothetical protein